MATKPSWAHAREPDQTTLAIVDDQQQLAKAAAVDRLSGGQIKLPLDHVAAVRELGETERAHRRSTAPGGRRWKQLSSFDDQVSKHEHELAALRARAAELRDQLHIVERADALRVADWLENGRRGDRPQSRKPQFEAEIEQLEQDAKGVEQLIDKTLARKAEHVEKHRGRLEKDAAKDLADAQRAFLDALEAAAQARSRLLDARATRLWVRRYPSDAALADQLHTAMVCGGLALPVRETLGDTQQRPAANIFAALERDSAVLATHGLEDRPDGELDVRKTAIWERTEEGSAALQREKARILEGMQNRNTRTAAWEE
jgi:hypothetical protein